MPFSHQIEGRIVHLRWRGVMATEELSLIGPLMRELSRELGFVPQLLHTFDEISGCDLAPLAAYEHSAERQRVPIPKPARAAAVAKTVEVRDMARVFQLLNRNPGLEMEVFDSEEDARAWLLEPFAGGAGTGA